MPTEKIVIHVYGPRNEILRSVTLPKALLYDLDPQLAAAQQTHPMFNTEAFLRWLWVRGLDATRMGITKNNVPDPNRIPQPKRGLLDP